MGVGYSAGWEEGCLGSWGCVVCVAGMVENKDNWLVKL